MDGRSAWLGRTPGWRKQKGPGVTPKSAAPGSGIGMNESYQAATVDMRATRDLRDVWAFSSAPYRGALFTTLPPALVGPCIKPGTSECGVCPYCGAPWQRMTELSYRKHRPSGSRVGREARGTKYAPEGNLGSFGTNLLRDVTTTDLRPTCACYDERYRAMCPEPRNARKRRQREAWPGRWKCVRTRLGGADWLTVPATVLDPIASAGTVDLVAERLGRDSILIEINPDCADMSRKRIKDDAPPRAQPQVAA